ncbi:hypothetical protein [Yoonia sp.]|uniref:hypothetical protein n=1 Tax=Yoonia sp. TaxID=2212373 RepID=UPI0025D8A62D|nr:hypothetical protein [Yoonia sp.]
MSSFLLQMFAFMLCTFLLGLLLGWLVWRYGGASQQALDSVNTEVDFWRSNLEHCRVELGNEQNTVASLREEKAALKKRLAARDAQVDPSGARPAT